MKIVMLVLLFVVVIPASYIYVFGCPAFFTLPACGINENRALFVLIVVGYIMIALPHVGHAK